MATIETQTPNLRILALVFAAALAAGITWTLWVLRRKPGQRFTNIYEEVLTSSEYAVKGRFDE